MCSWATVILWIAVALPDAADIDAALRRVLEADDYQTELPQSRRRPPELEVERRAPEPPPRPERRAPPPEPLPTRPQPGPEPADRAREPRGDSLTPIGPVLFWTLVGVLAIVAAVYVARELVVRRRAKDALGGQARTSVAPAAAAEAPIPEHERLALSGRHAEAIHAILLEVLATIGAARAGLRPAWTSREILGLVQLEEAAHRALASLVGLVEVTRFGGTPAREAEYRNAVLWSGTIGGAVR
jgi:hypothetical protein